MTVHVFVGPTLDIRAARQLLPDATFLPPVSQGDVLRSATRRPTAIGIIDGRFHDVPAVWHKEILWALSRGIPVYGSASMGALRAAELAPYGMRGVGKIFEAYHSGLLNDDDEVAVAHGDADSAYHPTNEAMVSIRETLREPSAPASRPCNSSSTAMTPACPPASLTRSGHGCRRTGSTRRRWTRRRCFA